MKRLIGSILLVLMIALIIHAQDTNTNRDDLIPDLMREINLWRLNSNLEPVVYSPLLEQLAIYQADYLISLPSIPVDLIHTGPRGESPRERSQFPEFAWATYGHPQLFAVTEIAAIGSINSAMAFWQSSDIHTRSSLNPTYREVGVAARQYGTDVLFIVVFGGRPNQLSALPDPDTNTLYLTNERNEWQGDWLGVATEYRLLDEEREPITNWLEWEPNIDLPEVAGNFFYIEYQDGTNRVTSRVLIEPIWSLADRDRAIAVAGEAVDADIVEANEALVDEAIAALPTSTPTQLPTTTPTQSVFATSTPLPSATSLPSPTFVIPTLTPRPEQVVRLEYDDTYFTLINPSVSVVDLYGMTFTDGNFTYSAITWEVPADEINIGALPANHCLQLSGFSVNTGINFLPQCSFVRSFVTISEDNFFWVDGTFDVLIENQVIATCNADDSMCEFRLE